MGQRTAFAGDGAPGDGPSGLRHAVDVGALEQAVGHLGPVSGSLRLGSTRLVDTCADPGDPPAGDHVLDLQQAACEALLALSRGLEASAGSLSRVVQRHADADAEVEQVLHRTGGDAP